MRYTRKCHGSAKGYRIPMLNGQEMYTLEDSTITIQRNERIMDAYFGKAVDLLGEYEDIGTPEEIKKKLERLDKLERRNKAV